ncbi:hypothetical protein BELL_1038g00020 [Botrytis elliptica]|uniref:NADAR domain-containing protein n=1 Tax=Botrytis elliptica TaxID=278938 RepID=A0A4Z1IYP1_9HELO|nr:hypothetical protein EAE99_010486 [Botrytis elliptica]TGO64520.1 hypothetical protein BELL_1038g00020 [Botrytis elliptica]
MAPGTDSLTYFFAKGNKLEEVNSILFSGHKAGNAYSHFSNFYMESFEDGSGITYSCGEAYFQAGKAWQVRDIDKFAQIAHAKSGYDAKRLGNEVKGLDVARWNKSSSYVMRNALYHKYRNNQAKREDLINTGNKCLVEAKDDLVWGSGLKTAALTLSTPISEWPGDNKLGEELMRGREYFKSLQEQPRTLDSVDKADEFARETSQEDHTMTEETIILPKNEHPKRCEKGIVEPLEEIKASNASNERKRKFDQTVDKLVEKNKKLLKKLRAGKGSED